MPVTFVGVELAGRGDRERTSIVVTRGSAARTSLVARAEGIIALERAADFVARHATANTVVAVDAPLILCNPIGQRPCDAEVFRRFGRFRVTPRTADLSLHLDPPGARFAELLRWDGFRHDPRLDEPKVRAGRWLFEVHAQPAQVVLFELANVVERGRRLAERRLGLRLMQGYLRSLGHCAPALERSEALDELLIRDVGQLRGRRQVGRYEDTLDALFCSYLALHCWRWGRERNEMIGDLESGYVIVPTRPQAPTDDGQPNLGDGQGCIDDELGDDD